MLSAPYEITIYGSNTGYLASDSASLVNLADVQAISGVVSVTISCYTIYPFYDESVEVRSGEGGVRVEDTSQYNSYTIRAARFVNANADYGDMTTFDSLFAVLRKNYKYLTINTYKRTLHTADKAIKIVAPKRDIKPSPARVDVELLLTKVKQNT